MNYRTQRERQRACDLQQALDREQARLAKLGPGVTVREYVVHVGEPKPLTEAQQQAITERHAALRRLALALFAQGATSTKMGRAMGVGACQALRILRAAQEEARRA